MVLALAVGCSSDSPAPQPNEPTAGERLAAAKEHVDEASSMHLTLTSESLPEDVSGVVSAEGWGAHPPAFKGTFQVKVNGVAASSEVVAVDGTVYAKLPFVSVFAQVDPATLGAPDPATLFDPDTGLTSLLTETDNPVAHDPIRDGADVLLPISGTLDGRLVTDLLGTGAPGTYDATFGLLTEGEDAGQLRTVELTGPFFDTTPSTYLLTLDRYGEPVEITKP